MSSPKADALSSRIFTLRGQRVILDADLAQLYGTSTRAFNQAIKRNAARFPNDFAYRKDPEGVMSQVLTS